MLQPGVRARHATDKQALNQPGSLFISLASAAPGIAFSFSQERYLADRSACHSATFLVADAPAACHRMFWGCLVAICTHCKQIITAVAITRVSDHAASKASRPDSVRGTVLASPFRVP